MTRHRAPVEPPAVLTIAGSDSGGGAGIQADLKTIEAGGAFGTSVITSVTAQHTRGVQSTHLLPLDEIEAQYDAVTDDFDVQAVKTGMLAAEPVIELVAERLAASDVLAVIDPVMVAASGDRLLDEGAESAYEALAREATLLTPNADEAEVLTDITVDSTEAAIRAGESLVEDGVPAALVKGGHVEGEAVVDVLVTEETIEQISHPRVDTDATHGSGCMLSSAIATRLAYGDDLETAVRTATDLLARAVRYSLDIGEGPGAVHHMVAARDRAERDPTAEQVRSAVAELGEMDLRPLAEGPMNVAGATPYAEVPGECATADGGLGFGRDGLLACGDVRYGTEESVAQSLLAAREFHPAYRFALACRFDEAVEAALAEVDWAVGGTEGVSHEGVPTEAFRAAFEDERAPAGIVDPGTHGVESRLYLFAADPTTLLDQVRDLLAALE
jgi:hydroxymethylpyrimidine/phosphomethylpyrimidine kinase